MTTRDLHAIGCGQDLEWEWLYNRSGAATAIGDVLSMNDLGTNTTYDLVDGTENDVDRNALAIVAADINTRKRVALDVIPNGERGRFAIRGRVQLKATSMAATCVMGGVLTASSAAADGSTVVAKTLFVRLNTGGTGPLDAFTLPQQTFGITKEATTSTAAVVWCDFEGDGAGIVAGVT